MEDAPARREPAEPVWLVRIVLVLLLVGFSAYAARQLWLFAHGLLG